MKKALFTLAIAFSAYNAQAQFPYVFSVQNEPYLALTGATSLNGQDIWDDEDYTAPLGFSYAMGDKTTSDLNLAFTQLVLTSLTTPVSNGFIISSADLTDRSNNTFGTTPSSPISYQIVGSSPNRIFKMEMSNAGFYDDANNTASIDMQVWMYEGSNIFEIRFGHSNGTPGLFYENGKPLFGFIKNVDFNSGAVEKIYYLKDAAANPRVDSTSNITTLPSGLDSYPSYGTVYRFSPRTTSVANVGSIAGLNVYPTNAETVINVETSVAANYTITAANGSKVGIAGTTQPGTNSINVGALASGLYILTLENETSRSIVRFTKL